LPRPRRTPTNSLHRACPLGPLRGDRGQRGHSFRRRGAQLPAQG
jgi:hypothetical protein